MGKLENHQRQPKGRALRLIVFLLAMLLSAQAAAQGFRVIGTEGPDGDIVQVIVMENTPCPTSPDRPCFARVIYGTNGNAIDLQHERDHVAGMTHGAWQPAGNGDNCALIVKAGYTKWTPGKLMCRAIDRYYEVDP